MKLGRLLLNACAVVLLANLWLSQIALADAPPPGKRGIAFADEAKELKDQALPAAGALWKQASAWR